MATSGVKTYQYTTQQLVKDAFNNASIITKYETISNEDYNEALRMLNLLMEEWRADGFNVWQDKRATLFLENGEAKYTLGGTAHATESYVQTTLSNDEVAGSQNLELADTTGINTGDNVGVILDDATLFWSTVSGLGQVTTYDEDFSSDTGFTYDNTKTEFSAGQIQQKSQRPTNAIFGATYTSSINASWGDGGLVGTGTGSPVITSNKLDLSGGTLKYVDYNATSNTSIQTGAVKVKYTPNYSGTPASTQVIYGEFKANGDNSNTVSFTHLSTTGNLNVVIRDSTGGVIVNASLGLWNPTASTTYEIELNYDITAGATRLFVDGTQFGATQVGTGTRDTNIGVIRIGTASNPVVLADFFIEDLVRFNAVQHTANYTAGYTLQEYDYIEDLVSLPNQSGLSITEYISFITSQTSNGRWNINGYYWNGSAWVNSDNSYAQMNTASDINTNISTLTLNGQILIKLRMEASNTQSKVDNMTITYADNTVATVRISLSGGLPSSASAGATVYVYTDKITKPFELADVTLKQSDNNNIVLLKLAREEYFGLSNRASTGNPNQYYFHRKRDDGDLYVYSTPTDLTQVIEFTYQPYFDIFAEQNETPDYPLEWYNALMWNLALELCTPYGKTGEQYSRVEMKAQRALLRARNSDNEDAKLIFKLKENDTNY